MTEKHAQALLSACDEWKIRVTGIDLHPPDRPDCFVADICGPDLADHIPDGIDAIIHLAAISRDADSQGRASACFSVNVMGTLNLIEAARTRGVDQFIFASSEWVYDGADGSDAQREDNPLDAARLTSEYALSKYVSEINLRQAFARGFCPATVLRFGIVYGPRADHWSAVESLLHTVATQDDVRVGSLATARRYIHVDDIASAILASAGLPGFEILNIQGPRLVSLGDIIESSARVLGRTPNVIETDADRPSVRWVSDEKALQLLGWRAEVDLVDGLKSLLPALGLNEIAHPVLAGGAPDGPFKP